MMGANLTGDGARVPTMRIPAGRQALDDLSQPRIVHP